MSRGERKAMMRRDHPALSLSRQCKVLVRQANWQKVGGASPPERRSNRTMFLREPCVGSREGAGEASVWWEL